MSTFLKTIKEFLSESPQMVDLNKRELEYLRMPHLSDVGRHALSGEIISTDGSNTITKVNRDATRHDDFSRQYLRHDGKVSSLRANFSNHRIPSKPELRGSYASQIIKSTDGDVFASLKSIYDHELSNHDYLATDATQYQGGKYIWKRLAKDYSESGKHLYVHDENGLRKISNDYVSNNENVIWGKDDDFSKIRLIVSNKEI